LADGAAAEQHSATLKQWHHFHPRTCSLTKEFTMIKITSALLCTALLLAGGNALADDMMKKDAMAKDGMKKDSMAKDSMKKDSMAKDGMKKDSMAKDSMKTDSMAKDDMKKDKMMK
jgi:pentapeptide MXKDX repeat protein